jgi:hypothetical protein
MKAIGSNLCDALEQPKISQSAPRNRVSIGVRRWRLSGQKGLEERILGSKVVPKAGLEPARPSLGNGF